MTEQVQTQDALQIIRKALELNGNTPPAPLPSHLNLKGPAGPSRVFSMVGVFQPRQMDGRRLEGDKHIQTLKDAIGSKANPTYLDPLVVWWGGDRWYVIDGHHRRMAYLSAGVHKNIPVMVFAGSLEEALAQAVAANSKDRLPMSLQEKLDRAWFLTVTTELSRDRIRRSCSVSDGSVKNMRKVRDVLLANPEYTRETLAELSWQDARDAHNGSQPRGDHDNAWFEKQADEYARRLKRTFGPSLARNADVLAAALTKLDRRFPEWLCETGPFGQYLDDNLDRLVEERDHSDY